MQQKYEIKNKKKKSRTLESFSRTEQNNLAETMEKQKVTRGRENSKARVLQMRAIMVFIESEKNGLSNNINVIKLLIKHDLIITVQSVKTWGLP